MPKAWRVSSRATQMAEGPFPEHYEPFENPLGYNPLHPKNKLATSNPAGARVPDDRAMFGTHEEFPHVATSYRLTEHFHYWTKHARLNAVIQPEQFVEIGEELAKEIGVVHGADRVKVSSKRGHIISKAVVTKRIKRIDHRGQGKPIHTVGLPIHFGFKGQSPSRAI
jgi:formate dehydrogenase major subunit